jgi:hypothetical protein
MATTTRSDLCAYLLWVEMMIEHGEIANATVSANERTLATAGLDVTREN